MSNHHSQYRSISENSLLKTNHRHFNYDDFVGQQVLKYDNTIKGKLVVKTSSPFANVCVHVNGTISVQFQVSVTEQMNIHCTIPYKGITEGSVIAGESLVPMKGSN